MNKRLYTLILSLVVIALTTMAAENGDLKFNRIDTRDGLSNSQVTSILKDSRGFVWIGTPYGLNRYDGYRVRSYFAAPNDSMKLRYDFIDDIYEGYGGVLWLRHSTRYCIFNPSIGTFSYAVADTLKSYGMKKTDIENLYIDKHHNLWVKALNGPLYSYNAKRNKLIAYDIDYALGGDGSSRICFFSEVGKSVVLITNRGEMLCFNEGCDKLVWKSNYLARTSNTNLNYKLYVDPQSNYWAMVNGQVKIYMQRNKKWYDSLTQLLSDYGIEGVPSDVIVWDVIQDTTGKIWLSTDHNGAYVIDLKARTATQYVNIKTDETSLSDNTLTRFYSSPDGQLWIGSYKNGANQVSTVKSQFSRIPVGDVNTIVEDHEGWLWLGTNDKGIVRYNPYTKQTITYNKENSGFGSNVIVCSCVKRNGAVLFGTYGGGLIRYHNGHFTNIRATGSDDGLVMDNVWAVSEDAQGNTWIATLGGGLQRIDAVTGKFTTINNHKNNLGSDYLSSLSATLDQQLIVGTSVYYSIVNPKTFAVKNFIVPRDSSRNSTVAQATTQVVMDSRGLVWHGSLSGVSVYNPKTGLVSLLDDKSGLIGSEVCGIIEDNNHTMWVTTDHGVSNIMVKKLSNIEWQFSIRSFNSRDGLQQGPFNKRSICKTSKGQILVGGLDGVDIIDPSRSTIKENSEKPIFSGLMMFGEEVEPGSNATGRVVLERALSETQSLTLKNYENQFAIQLATNQGIARNRARFIYKLEGFSNKWITTDESNPNITFMSLPSGTYSLVVKIVNSDGSISAKDSRLNITIDPPFYLSWWAYTLYILVLASLGYYYHRKQSNRLRLEKLKMENDKNKKIEDERNKLYTSITSDLTEPFERTFASIDKLMKNEKDDVRYEQELEILSNVERLLGLIDRSFAMAKRERMVASSLRDTEVPDLDAKLVKDATDYVEANLSNSDITVETMASALCMSRVQLYKRLLSLTGSTPSEFIRNIRLHHAEQYLRNGQYTVNEVSYKVGFGNPRYLSKYFKEKYGVMPSQYRG